MRKLFSILFLLMQVAGAVAQTIPPNTNALYFPVGDLGISPQNRMTETLTLVAPNPRIVTLGNGTQIGISQNPITRITDTNGYAWFTNIQYGSYNMSLSGFPGTVFPLYVGTNTSGTVDGWTLYTNAAALPPDPTTNYYTQAQINALLGPISSATNSIAITNGYGIGTSLTNSILKAPNLFGNGTMTNGSVQFFGGDAFSIYGSLEIGDNAGNAFSVVTDGGLVYWDDNVPPDASTWAHMSDATNAANAAAQAATNGAAAPALKVNNGSDFANTAQAGNFMAAQGNAITNLDVNNRQLAASLRINGNAGGGGTSGTMWLNWYPLSGSSTFNQQGAAIPPVGDQDAGGWVFVTGGGGEVFNIDATMSTMAWNGTNTGFPSLTGGDGAAWCMGQFSSSGVYQPSNMLSVYGQDLSSGVNINDQTPFGQVARSIQTAYGGGGESAAYDLPPSRTQVGAMMPHIPFYVSMTGGTGDNYNTKQIDLTNTIYCLVTNGIQGFFTNALSQPVIIDVQDSGNLFQSTRDGNGRLQINTTTWPSGTNLYTNFTAFGFGWDALLYFDTIITNKMTVDWNGVFNGPSGFNTPCILPNTARLDVDELYELHCNSLRASDRGDGGPAQYLQMARILQNAMQLPDMDRTQTSFPTQAYPWNFWGPIIHAGSTPLSPMSLMMLVGDLGQTIPELGDSINVYNVDQLGIGNGILPGPPTNVAVQVMNRFRVAFTNYDPTCGPGHYGPGGYNAWNDGTNGSGLATTNVAQLQVSANLMTLSFIEINVHTNTPWSTQALQIFTNTAMLAIANDPLQTPPVMVFDNGYTNTSCFARALSGGSEAVMFANETNNASNLVVNFSTIPGMSTNGYYDAYSVWEKKDYGAQSGSFTISVPALGCALVTLIPTNGVAALFTGNGSGLTNIQAGTAGVLSTNTSTIGQVLANVGNGAVGWTNAPTITGANLTAVVPTTLTGAGQVPTAALGTGTASIQSFLRGDQTYQPIPPTVIGGLMPYSSYASGLNYVSFNGTTNGTTVSYVQSPLGRVGLLTNLVARMKASGAMGSGSNVVVFLVTNGIVCPSMTVTFTGNGSLTAWESTDLADTFTNASITNLGCFCVSNNTSAAWSGAVGISVQIQ
jgi:hypothetical protein